MKQLTIFHFSGTGNTRYVTDYLARCMEKMSWSVQNISITGLTERERDSRIAASDAIFLAYPIYGSDMPENMRRFIEALPVRQGLSVGVICTQLLFSGDGTSILYRLLKKKGYKQDWGYQINMPNNLCIKGSPLFQSSDYGVHEKKHLARARKKVEGIARAVDAGRRRVGDHTFIHLLLGLTQRPAYRLFAIRMYQNALSIDKDKCIKCGKCIRSCPEQVIGMTDGRVEVIHKGKCLACLRCLNFCPASAVAYKKYVREPLYKGPTKEIYKDLFK